ncbi:MAG TPA: hypothetical protein VFO25_00880 [Candidatus Eremiobacteraceae bacterium]|nr:hypothetical protein [Candidatus Eremiobacteraceae bacterium]
MMQPRLYAWAIGVAAVAGAAGGHAAVDVLGSLRVFAGTYARYQHSFTVFAAIAVAAIVLGFLALSAIGTVIESLRHETPARRLELLRAMRRPSPATAALVYGLQIPLLLSLEALEQVQRFGHPIGLGVSLGGPPLVTLSIHALCALAVTIAVFRGIRTIVDVSTAIARVIIPIVRRLIVTTGTTSLPAWATRVARRSIRPTPLALHIANRPPPRLAFN